jgi:hypothetical protein
LVSRLLLAALAMWAVSSCSRAARVTTRTVTAYVPQACAADGSAYAEYLAYGDFDPAAPPATGYFLSAVGQTLPDIDGQARAVVMTASEVTSGVDRAWEGVAAVPSSGDVDVLLLPTLASCPLTATVGPRVHSVLAPVGSGRVLVVGGTANPTPFTFLARLDTGAIDAVTPDLLTPRTDASVTAFGPGALVAGGTSSDGRVLDTAEAYSTSAGAAGGFDQQNPLQLSEPRTRHGAVVLVSGATLLVGGKGGSDGTTVLGTMETIDPVTHVVQEEGLPTLNVPRYGATVLRLASGEILVAGGFDASDDPVQTLEWLNPDATSDADKQTPPLAQGSARAFIALEGGGALAVLTPPAPTPGFQNVWVIDATGALEVATPIPGALASPVLFGGAQGAPVLWTGDRWLQWQPYAGMFGELDVLDDVPAAISDATCAPDPGLALWLDEASAQLNLLRFDTRNIYSALPGPLLVTGPAETAPDRLDAVSWDVDQGLVLTAGTPGAAAFVTDRTYADVAIDVDAPTGEPAMVALRDDLGNELDVGGPSCPGALVPGDPSTVHVQRTGGTVTWSLADGASGTCAGALGSTARVSVGLRASPGARGVMKNLKVTRLGTP